MGIYFIFIFATIIYGVIYSNVKENRFIFDIIYIIIFIFIFGFRYQVGVDWFNYIRVYERSLDNIFNFSTMEIGYKYLNIISDYLGFGYLGVIFISTCLFSVFTIYGCKKSRVNPYYFLSITAPYHLVMSGMNYTRQSIALSIMILSFSYLLNGNRRKFVYWLLISSLFHSSAILFLSLLFYKVKIRIQVFFFIILMPVLYIISINRYSGYIETNLSSAGLYLRLIYIIISLFILFLLNRYESSKQIKDNDINRVFLISIPIMIIISIISSTMADRISYYFILLVTLVIMRQIKYCKPSIIIAVYSVLFFVSISVLIIWVCYSKYIPSYIFKSSIDLF